MPTQVIGRKLILLNTKTIDQPPHAYLQANSTIFATFDQQDSGNIAYGVTCTDALGNQHRYFVKTAGDPADTRPYLDHAGRVGLLRNAVRLAQSCDHHTLCRLYNIIESPLGPLLVYEWIDGELLSVPRARRDDPTTPYQRFRALPPTEIVRALDQLYELHHQLAAAGWVACDLYDGCLLYNFATHTLRVLDLDTYHQGPFVNTMGRMFGSARFMAPEEFTLGATIDQRTTVFTLGRMAAILLGDGTLAQTAFRGTAQRHEVVLQACQPQPNQRFATVADFCTAWFAANNQESTDGSADNLNRQ